MSTKLNNKCFIIAEAGVNHNRNLSLALEMIQIAASAGVDAIKFQTFDANKLVSRKAMTATYQKAHTGFNNQFDMLKQLELPKEWYEVLVNESQKHGIEFMSTPFDEDSLEMLIHYGMKKIKIGSGDLTNIDLLQSAAHKNLPIFLSTGMATIEEIENAVKWIQDARKNIGLSDDLNGILTLLHCTSNYPCPIESVNLRCLSTLKEKFGLPIGYSDHTIGLDIAMIAMGFCINVYERHFTLDKTLPGPDHKASIEPAELKELVKKIRLSECALGTNIKAPTVDEREVMSVVRRSIALKVHKKAGSVLQAKDLCILRPATGIAPQFKGQLIGRTLSRDINASQLLKWEDFI